MRRHLILGTALSVAVFLCLVQKRRPAESRASGPVPAKVSAPAQVSPIPAAASPVAVTQPAAAPASTFSSWTQTYLAAKPDERPALVAQGVALAEARRPVFHELIRTNPREALARAVPMVVRQQLPEEITSLLEKRVADRGVIRVYQGVGPGNTGAVPTHRVAELKSGQTYEAHVYGRREQSVLWVPDASVNGVAIDADLAINEDPIRPLEVGEIPDATKPAISVCPVSGITSHEPEASPAPITDETPAVEAYGEIVYLCNGSHTTIYRQQLIMAEGGSGGAQTFTGILPAAPTPSIGNIKVLVIPMTFADQNDTPSSESGLYTVMRDVGQHYATASYGKLTLATTVTPPVRLPHNEAWYVQKDTSNGGTIDGLGKEHSDARAEARKMGFDDDEFDCIVVRLKGGARPAGGWGGGRSVWIYGNDTSTTAHEVGHAFGLAHANFWDTAGTSAIGAGTNEEYGGHWDVMGGVGLPKGHYNAQGKNQIRWLPDDYVARVSTSGLYRIYAQDQPILDPTKRFALKIVKDSARTYWGELRGVWTGDTSRPWGDMGLILGWRNPDGGGGNIQLIDTTPGSPFGKDDSPISLGRTFSDTEAGIHLTTLAVNAPDATTPKSVDVQVHFGQFPGNHSPTLSLSTPAAVVPKDVPVVFTATATDADGDALAYSWQNFGDTGYRAVAPNLPTYTRTFSTSGSYVVTCTVSDMKGGSVTRNQLVTVGSSGGKFTINGRVTAGGAGLGNVVILANAANGVVTDSDGRYTIPNLGAATYSLTAALYGYSFVELFNNNITVGPGFTGADFEAAATPRVTLAAATPSATEGGATGLLTLTRTGDASQPLTVSLTAPNGTATLTTDYTLSPALAPPSSGMSTLSFPAGADTLDVTVTAVNDTASEGPETAAFTLASGNGYLTSGATSATVQIEDNDTTLPKLRLSPALATIEENSVTPAVITLTRSGNIVPATPALAVSYTISGTATNGTDCALLSGTATIPAGAASVEIPVTPSNDAASEGIESVIVKITGGASWLADPSGSTATVNIIDDDVQLISVTAPDPVATETASGPPDTATFLVNRTGDISQPLTLSYAVSGITSGTTATALHGVDYELLPGVLTIPAGQGSGTVTIIPRADGIGEAPESVTLQLGAGPTNYRLTAQNTASITINDAVDPAYVEVSGTNNGKEGATPTAGTFTFSLKGSSAGSVIVNYTVSGTATSGTDYTALSGTVTIPGNGTNTVDVSVPVLNDAVAEDLETVVVTITPGAAYQTFPTTSKADIWIYDDEQPTVFVDAHDSDTVPTISENGSAGAFYLSRTLSTSLALAPALTVNYTVSGTATNGTDCTLIPGTATIPAGAYGVEVPVTPTNDTLAEGTETLVLTITSGSYGHGAPATLYISDDETPAISASFTNAAAAGLESATTVTVPVKLSAAAATPVTVEYQVDSVSRTAGVQAGAPPSVLPYWVRCVRTGNDVTGYISPDGVTWTAVSTQTLSMSSTAYRAGLHVCSYNTSTLCTAVFDNVSVTGLSAGGTQGPQASGDIGTTALAGSFSETGGTYTVNGAGDNVTGTTDQGQSVYWPITNSANCTITARVVSITNSNAAAIAGVMIRETSTNTSRRGYMGAIPSGGMEYHYRLTSSGQDAVATATPAIPPLWVRLQRTGNVFSAFQSSSGTTWTQIGTNTTLPFGSELITGLALSSQSEGTQATATFDNVTLTPGPLPQLAGRTVGLTSTQGTDSLSGGVYTLTASGDGWNGTGDDGHFLAAPVSGDFILTARITSASNASTTATSPQAGLMVREVISRRSRMAYVGGRPGAVPELVTRNLTTSTAQGSTVDYTLGSGVLTFPVGSITQDITFSVKNDNMPESDETISLVLRSATGAALGTPTQFSYTIVDDDAPLALPSAGFAAAASTSPENAGTVLIPVSLSFAPASAATIGYAITAGTATTADFTPATGTLTFAPGQTVAWVPVALLDDTTIEPAETVTLTLSGPVGCIAGSLATHTLTITDEDSPVVTLTSDDTAAAETGDTARFTLTRTGSTAAALTVNLTRAGTATVTSDYTGVGTPATIPAGQSSLTVTLTPVQDTAVEGQETVTVDLAAGTGYVTGTPSGVVLTIADDDRNVVTIAATTPNAVEGGASGVFTLTRTGNLAATLAVTLTTTGNATTTTDYTTNPASVSTVTFSANQASRTITVIPVNDTATEGTEVVLLQIAAGGYDIGGAGYASVNLIDNDIPPAVFIDSPGAQGVVISPANGVNFSAVMADDGLPGVTTGTWSLVSGPGTATFTPVSSTTGKTSATFSAPGTYVVRVTASDTQFTATDQISVNIGGTATLPEADWIAADIGAPTSRGSTARIGSVYTLTGAGTGYTSNSDRAHALTRTVTGDGEIIARLTANSATTAESGLSIRDSLHRYARRANLLYTNGTLRFRTRLVNNTTDTSVSAAGLTLPLWLRLTRVEATDTITASYAPDAAGSPGAWVNLGTPTAIAMDAAADYSLTVDSGSDTVPASSTFDHLALTPAPAPGPAILTEDFGDGTQTGTYAYDSATGVHTLNGQPGGLDSKAMFWGRQVTGDFTLTVLQLNATSGADSAMSGVMIRDTMDDGPMAFVGRNPFGSYSSFVWRTNNKGGTDGVNGLTQKTRWMRLIRRGSFITALHAPNNSGVPGAWVQMGQPVTTFLQPTVIAGLAVCNGTGVGLNSATFSNFSITPLHTAPIVDAGTAPAVPASPMAVLGSVTDDGLPSPYTIQWTATGPSAVTFADPAALSTTATFAATGAYRFRLSADDGIATTFADLAFTSSLTPFQQWQVQKFGSTSATSAPPTADDDHDGLENLVEYATGSNPATGSPSPLTAALLSSGQTFRLTLPRNPAATDVTLVVEYCDSLQPPWSSAGLITQPAAANQLIVDDPNALSLHPRRLYRVRAVLP